MGVDGLWKLLGPGGAKIPLDDLRGQTLAVDASVWLYQFVKAMRDRESGAMIEHAHLIGLFRRLCKLEYWGVRAVLVFDGPAPKLKKRTIKQRRRRRQDKESEAKRIAERVLLERLKLVGVGNAKKALRNSRKLIDSRREEGNVDGHDSDDDENGFVFIEEDEHKNEGDNGMIGVSLVNDNDDGGGLVGGSGANGTGQSELLLELDDDHNDDNDLVDSLPLDLSAEQIAAMPASTQYEWMQRVREDLREKKRPEFIEAAAGGRPESYSSVQLSSFLESAAVNVKIEDCRRAMNAAYNASLLDHYSDRQSLIGSTAMISANAQRIASEPHTHYYRLTEEQLRTHKSSNEHHSGKVSGRKRRLSDLTGSVGSSLQCGMQSNRMGLDVKKQRRMMMIEEEDKDDNYSRNGRKRRNSRPMWKKSVDYKPQILNVSLEDSFMKKILNEAVNLTHSGKRGVGLVSSYWVCEKCKQKNHMKCPECSVCHSLKDHGSGRWVCPVCEFVNDRNNDKCQLCDTLKVLGISVEHYVPKSHRCSDSNETKKINTAATTSASAEAVQAEMDFWDTNTTGVMNENGGDGGGGSFETLMWECPMCGDENQPEWKQCHSCDMARPENNDDSSEDDDINSAEEEEAEECDLEKSADLSQCNHSDQLNITNIQDIYRDPIIIDHSPDSVLDLSLDGHSGAVVPCSPPLKRSVNDIAGTAAVSSSSSNSSISPERKRELSALLSLKDTRQNFHKIAQSIMKRPSSLISSSNNSQLMKSRVSPNIHSQQSRKEMLPSQIHSPSKPLTVELVDISEESNIVLPKKEKNGGDKGIDVEMDQLKPKKEPSKAESVVLNGDVSDDNMSDEDEESDSDDDVMDGLPSVAELDRMNNNETPSTVDSKISKHSKIESVNSGQSLSSITHEFRNIVCEGGADEDSDDEKQSEMERMQVATVTPGFDDIDMMDDSDDESSEMANVPVAAVCEVVESSSVNDSAMNTTSDDTSVLNDNHQSMSSIIIDNITNDDNNNNNHQRSRLDEISDEFDHAESQISKNMDQLRSIQMAAARDSDEITQEMRDECKELLCLFGVPFFDAPAEAEAQCAYLQKCGLVDGIITDDCDVFLFGGSKIYKNMFSNNKHVECFDKEKIQSKLYLDELCLIALALLLGSDYTEGVYGVGIVNGIEILDAFCPDLFALMKPDSNNDKNNNNNNNNNDNKNEEKNIYERRVKIVIEGLTMFREWVYSPNGRGKNAADLPPSKKPNPLIQTKEEYRRLKLVYFKYKHRNIKRNWFVPSDFPPLKVIDSYLNPTVIGGDNSSIDDQSELKKHMEQAMRDGRVNNGDSSIIPSIVDQYYREEGEDYSKAKTKEEKEKKEGGSMIKVFEWSEPRWSTLKGFCEMKLCMDEETAEHTLKEIQRIRCNSGDRYADEHHQLQQTTLDKYFDFTHSFAGDNEMVQSGRVLKVLESLKVHTDYPSSLKKKKK